MDNMMMKSTVIVALLILVGSGACPAQNWKLRKQGEDLKVYTAETPNSPYKSVRVECMVRGRFSQVVAVLFDLNRQKDWIFNDKSSSLLKQVKANEIIYYSEVGVPWPGTNRDFIAHLTVNQISPTVVNIESHAEPDFIPVKKDLVRLRHSNSLWKMTNLGGGKLQIVYEIQFDPEGSVPAWIINMFITKGPYETFDNLQDRINMPEYRNAHYDFIKD